METEIIEKMWKIDGKAQVGDNITQDEIDYFNLHYSDMVSEMNDNARHWNFYTAPLK